MDHTGGVDVGHGAGHGLADAQRLGERQRAGGDQRAQRRTADELQCQVRALWDMSVVEQFHQARMAKPGQQPRFDHEPLPDIGAPTAVGITAEHLERHRRRRSRSSTARRTSAVLPHPSTGPSR